MIKKGLTLIELMVAMSLFIIVMTLSVGGFIGINKVRGSLGQMKEVQQKTRLANETIIRYAKQAEYVRFPGASVAYPDGAGDDIEMYFDNYMAAKRFRVSDNNDILVSDCTPVSGSCDYVGAWGTESSLLGGDGTGVALNSKEVFSLHGTTPSVLKLTIDIRDGLRLENSIILGGLE